MDGVALRGGVLDADVVVQPGAGDEVAEGALRSRQLGIGLAVAAAAAEHADRAAVVERVALGADIDHRRGAVSVLGRQRTGEEAEAIGHARLERLTEAADRLGDDDAVDAVLDVRVIAAHVQLAE